MMVNAGVKMETFVVRGFESAKDPSYRRTVLSNSRHLSMATLPRGEKVMLSFLLIVLALSIQDSVYAYWDAKFGLEVYGCLSKYSK